jgi:hypothetical protein
VTVAPDLIERVVGFRKWRVTGNHLTSPYIPLRWDRPVAHARCYPANRNLMFGAGWLDEPHEAPHPECKCGIYAYYRPTARSPVPDRGRTFGIVSLWGRIEAHSNGMRAEHAEIGALAFCRELGARHREQIEAIAEQLGVECIEHSHLLSAASEYGSPLPSALTG